MKTTLKPIRTEADHDAALAEVERLWGAKDGTPEGDRLDILATLIDAYEAARYPMDPPIRSRRSGSAWNSRADPEGFGTDYRHADPCHRGVEPQARAVD